MTHDFESVANWMSLEGVNEILDERQSNDGQEITLYRKMRTSNSCAVGSIAASC